MKAEDLTNITINGFTFIEYTFTDKNHKRHWLCKCHCGNIFDVIPAAIKNGNTKSCGCLIKYDDLTNQKIGMIIFIKYEFTDKNGGANWLCLCDCGNNCILPSRYVLSGHTKSCGCIKHPNIINKKIGRLIVKNESTKTDKKNNTYYDCVCECGKLVCVTLDKLNRGHTRSCGCYKKDRMSERMKIWHKTHNICGKNSPRWNPNLTKEEREENENTRRTRTIKYNKWRDKVYKRDCYTCQVCKDNKGGNLVAHHIFAWNKYKKLRYTVSNGITLCKDCHKKFHKEYGKGNNTRKQFTKFRKNFNK